MRRLTPVLTALTLLLALVGCGDDDDSATPPADSTPSSASSTPASTSTTVAVLEPMVVLVTNDDGIGAPGIDAMVTALQAVDGLAIVVVAPAENQSGSSDDTVPGPVTPTESATASGVSGTAVDGKPADAVLTALVDLGIEPDLVVSGVNEGQNVGPFASLSGTVGAARTAARRGIPAVAASAGLGENADYAAAAALVVAWIEDSRDAILAGALPLDTITSFNVPGCVAGTARDLVQVPLGEAIPDGANPFETDCSVEPPAPPTDDVDAMLKGFRSQTVVPVEL